MTACNSRLAGKTLKEQLITELKRLKPVVSAAPDNYAAVMRAGKIVATLRDKWQVSDDEMKQILKRRKRTVRTMPDTGIRVTSQTLRLDVATPVGAQTFTTI